MELNRRKFLKTMGNAGVAVGVSASSALAKSSHENHLDSFGSLVDISRCIGCRKCEMACNSANKLPHHQDFTDRRVFAEERRPNAERFTVVNEYHSEALEDDDHYKKIFVKDQCRHCLKPACASACIVGALSKKEDGPVVYDETKCVGCRYCLVACPFQIPAYEDHNPVTPRVRKCTYCFERLGEGKMPACITMCPTQALIFGKRSNLLTIAKNRIKNNPDKYVNHIYGEKEAGGSSWLYLSPMDFSFFPKVGTTPPPKLTETLLSGVFGYAAVPTALFAVLGSIAWITGRKNNVDKNQQSKTLKGGN